MTNEDNKDKETTPLRKWRKRATLIFWLIITLIPFFGLFFNIFHPVAFYAQQEQWRAFAHQFPAYGPLIFIGLQILQVVVAPLSHYTVGYMGGFLYGKWLGTLYNWIGRLIGHVIAFWIARLLGRRLAQRFVSPKALATYDKFVSERIATLFLIYFLPLFPDDEISYLAGLSKMKFNWFLVANLLGHTSGSFLLAYAGSGIEKDMTWWVLFAINLLGFPLIWILHRRAKKRSQEVRSN